MITMCCRKFPLSIFCALLPPKNRELREEEARSIYYVLMTSNEFLCMVILKKLTTTISIYNSVIHYKVEAISCIESFTRMRCDIHIRYSICLTNLIK